MTTMNLVIKDTWKNLAKYREISWSRLTQYDTCQAYWFTTNYAEFDEMTSVTREDSRSIPGTIIQKMIEIFVNARVYDREDMKSFEDLLKWFNFNTRALFDLIAIPSECQHELEYKNARRYFSTSRIGMRKVQNSITSGMDPTLNKSIQPSFIDWDFFNKEHGSKEKFLEKIIGFFGPILELFVNNQIDLNKMLSEEYLRTFIFDDVMITGKIDFIYNTFYTKKNPFSSISDLKDKFIILDGKYKISSWVKKEQLFFYACLIYFQYKKVPGSVGFIDWSNHDLKMFDFETKYIEVLKHKLYRMVENGYKMRLLFEELQDKHSQPLIDLSQIELVYEPSPSNCTFCSIKAKCPLAAKTHEISEGINNKRETKACLESVKLDPEKDTHDISL